MKIGELLAESADEPIIVSLLHKLMKQHVPVMYVSMSEGDLKLRQVYFVGIEPELFSPTAPSDIANTPFTAIYFKAPGFYSWETDAIGDGSGNGTFGLPHRRHELYHIAKLPSVQGRTDFVFGLRAYVKRWEKEHEGK